MCEYRQAICSQATKFLDEAGLMTSAQRPGRESAKRGIATLKGFQGDPNFVLSLARGLKVIETFEGHAEGQSVADAARRTGFSRAAVRRLLMTLELLGYAESSGRVYRLKTRVLKLGFSYLSSSSPPTIAQPIAHLLS